MTEDKKLVYKLTKEWRTPESMRLNAEQGSEKTRSEAYMKYDERVSQSLTKLCVKNACLETGFARGRQAWRMDSGWYKNDPLIWRTVLLCF